MHHLCMFNCTGSDIRVRDTFECLLLHIWYLYRRHIHVHVNLSVFCFFLWVRAFESSYVCTYEWIRLGFFFLMNSDIWTIICMYMCMNPSVVFFCEFRNFKCHMYVHVHEYVHAFSCEFVNWNRLMLVHVNESVWYFFFKCRMQFMLW